MNSPNFIRSIENMQIILLFLHFYLLAIPTNSDKFYCFRNNKWTAEKSNTLRPCDENVGCARVTCLMDGMIPNKRDCYSEDFCSKVTKECESQGHKVLGGCEQCKSAKCNSGYFEIVCDEQSYFQEFVQWTSNCSSGCAKAICDTGDKLLFARNCYSSTFCERQKQICEAKKGLKYVGDDCKPCYEDKCNGNSTDPSTTTKSTTTTSSSASTTPITTSPTPTTTIPETTTAGEPNGTTTNLTTTTKMNLTTTSQVFQKTTKQVPMEGAVSYNSEGMLAINGWKHSNKSKHSLYDGKANKRVAPKCEKSQELDRNFMMKICVMNTTIGCTRGLTLCYTGQMDETNAQFQLKNVKDDQVGKECEGSHGIKLYTRDKEIAIHCSYAEGDSSMAWDKEDGCAFVYFGDTRAHTSGKWRHAGVPNAPRAVAEKLRRGVRLRDLHPLDALPYDVLAGVQPNAPLFFVVTHNLQKKGNASEECRMSITFIAV